MMTIVKLSIKNGGNVLFIILVVVALFGALTYAITESTRLGSGDIITEKQRLVAADIVQYGASLKSQADKIMLLEGIPAEQLDFSNNVYLQWKEPPENPVINSNPNCTNSRCKVFSTQGGPVVEKTYAAYANEDRTDPFTSGRPYYGHADVRRYIVEDIGSNRDEMVFILIQLDRNICEAINDILNLPDSTLDNSEPFGSVAGNKPYFDLNNPPATSVLGDEVPEIAGKPTGCFQGSYHFGYVYYQVLIEG